MYYSCSVKSRQKQPPKTLFSQLVIGSCEFGVLKAGFILCSEGWNKKKDVWPLLVITSLQTIESLLGCQQHQTLLLSLVFSIVERDSAIKSLLGMAVSQITEPGSSPGSLPSIQLLLMHSAGGVTWWFKDLCPWHPPGRPRWIKPCLS